MQRSIERGNGTTMTFQELAVHEGPEVDTIPETSSQDDALIKRHLNILMVEDIPIDAEMAERELLRAKISMTVRRVATEKKFIKELNDFGPDAIIADYSLPRFSGLEALRIVKAHDPELPFILVTGTQREEVAVQCMKEGADDYILKSSLKRLPGALFNALRKKEGGKERRQLEDDLKRTTRRIVTIFESITDAFFAVDPQWRLMYLNPRSNDLLSKVNKIREDLWGKVWWDEFPIPSDRPGVKELLRSMNDHVSVEFEEFYPSLDSWLYIRAYPSDDGLSIYAQDITERKRVNEALESKERRFRAVIENNIDGLILVDSHGVITYMSPSSEKLLGYNEFEHLGKNALSHIHPEDLPQLAARFSELVRNPGGSGSAVHRVRHKNGTWRWFETFAKNILDDPDVASIVVNLRDVTDEKRAEEKVREQANLLNFAQDAILVRDMNGKVTFWNQSAERIYGWKSEEILGMSADDFLSRDAHLVASVIERLEQEGKWMGEMVQVTKQGSEVRVESRWTLIRDGEGKTTSILVINTDVTEQRKIEQQFLRAQRMETIGTLAGGIAHDLNNVLTTILMATPMLRNEVTSALGKDIVESIEGAGKRGEKIVRQVLSFAKGMKGEKTTLHLRHLIMEVEHFLREALPPSIRIVAKHPKHIGPVYADATQLYQVLMNLCINARDAMPEGGELAINLSASTLDAEQLPAQEDVRPGSYAVLTVKDTGVGIADEIVGKIFDPFFTTKEPGKGTGLGLFTVMSIVRNHRGFLEVASKPGEGTEFKIFIPMSETPEEEKVLPEQKPPGGNGQTILLVEDEKDIRNLIHSSLETNGYKVITAKDGSEALAQYVQHRDVIELVLLDMLMPIINGPAAISALLRINPGIKAIIMSGTLGHQELLENIPRVIPFLQKPFTAAQLLTLVHEVLHGANVSATTEMVVTND